MNLLFLFEYFVHFNGCRSSRQELKIYTQAARATMYAEHDMHDVSTEFYVELLVTDRPRVTRSLETVADNDCLVVSIIRDQGSESISIF